MNYDDSYFSAKKSDEPEDLLMERLIRQDREIAQLKIECEIYKTSCYISDEVIGMMIDSMMEPIIIQEIIDVVPDEDYKEYLRGGMTVIDYYKAHKMISDMKKEESKKDGGYNI